MSVLDRSLQQVGGPDRMNIDINLNHSELFRAESKRLIQETNRACKRMQDDDSKQLDKWVRDVKFLQEELKLKLEEINLDTDALVTLQGRVMKALEATKEPLRVTGLCLEERMRRAPSERLHDEVNAELLKEREVFEEVASLLERVAEQISEQIRLNRSVKHHLEKDLKEKSEAQSIDSSCAIMTIHSINNQQMSKDNASLPSLTVSPKQYEHISELNISKAEQQKSSSVSLQALVESVLKQTAADTQKQFQATTTAFQLNIKQIKSAKSQMEEKLPKVLSEINSQQKIREDLQVAITENEHFRSLAQNRLALRRQRPGKERCRDPVGVQLLAEIQQLTAHIDRFQKVVAKSEEEQRVLVRCQLKLQENIDIKSKSLYIDEVVCTQLREPVVIHNF